MYVYMYHWYADNSNPTPIIRIIKCSIKTFAT